MSRSAVEVEAPLMLEQLASEGDDAPSLDHKLAFARQFRESSAERSRALDRCLIDEVVRLRTGLIEVRKHQAELEGLVEKMTAPPWFPATYLGAAMSSVGPGAIVAHGNIRRVVTLADGLAPDELRPGDEVLLTSELNAILAKSPAGIALVGHVAVFDRSLPDGRIVLTSRDEEIVVDVAQSLRDTHLKSGDLVRWDQASWMAFERVDKSDGADLFFEETPSETFEDIGGLDEQIEDLQRMIRLPMREPELARSYGLKPKRSVLLWGPPGTGKTMMARALVNMLRELAPSGRARFMDIRPSALNSMWFGESERAVRRVYAIARQASESEPAVPVLMYFDEIDSLGGARGQWTHRVDDKVLNAFMAELDGGLSSRGHVLVVASTNRRDALDPGLTRPGRLGDFPIHVPMPNRQAANAILRKHLRSGIPYASNGCPSDTAREEIIESAVSRLYSPNADTDLAVIMFRDGTRRTVKANEMVSGAVIAKIAAAAVERAFYRRCETGQSGVRLDDVVWAIDEEFQSTSRLLTPANCRAYLCDLPQDLDVVSVQPVTRRVSHAQRYSRPRTAA